MSDSEQPELSDGLDVASEEIARIVIKDRPEITACLDGLVFRGQEDAMIPLLRAALINTASSVLLDLEDEDAMSACIADLKVQVERMPLAVKALEWEIQSRRNPPVKARRRSEVYRAEIHELLHGPLPPLELVNEQERDVVVRRVQASLQGKTQADVDPEVEELQAILDETDTSTTAPPYFIRKLTRPRMAEWLARWSEQAFKETHEKRALDPRGSNCPAEEIGTEVSLLRGIQQRLHPLVNTSRGDSVQKLGPASLGTLANG